MQEPPDTSGEGRDGMRLTAESVEVSFAGLKAIDRVDVQVERGEILGLIGPNGAGKTTLVNVLTGFQRPTAGRVLLNGTDVTKHSPERRARLGIARTFQGGRLFSHLTVLENVALGAVGLGKSQRDATRKANQLLEMVGLLDRSAEPAQGLPHGDERKVGIARALAGEPEFVLLDEPAAGLNDGESAELVEALRDIRSSLNVGILLIEHNVWLVMTVCHRTQVLDYGKTIAVGAPDEIRSDPAVIAAYLGTHAEVTDA